MPRGDRELHLPRRRSRDLDRPLRRQGRDPAARARSTSATSTRRCATSGTSATCTWTPVPRLLLPVLEAGFARLRQWDMVSSARVDRLIANSRLVAWRIKHYWNRSAEVIPPPVDTEFFTPGEERGDNLLTVAALVPYKRVEVAIAVARKLGRTLEIVGTGPRMRALRRLGGPDVRFLGWLDRERAAGRLPPRGGPAGTQHRGLRHGHGRGAGLRHAGGRSRRVGHRRHRARRRRGRAGRGVVGGGPGGRDRERSRSPLGPGATAPSGRAFSRATASGPGSGSCSTASASARCGR